MWSNWNWHAPPPRRPPGGPDVARDGRKLEQHMQAEPNDLKGWLMLGRSYVALERADDAVDAYEHAHRLDPGNVDAMLGLGEAMSLRARGEITPAGRGAFRTGGVLGAQQSEGPAVRWLRRGPARRSRNRARAVGRH
jgi:cytochrome c-type biogenesis protein CcmH/NrfG